MIKYHSGGDGIPAWVNDYQTGIVLPAKVILFIEEYAPVLSYTGARKADNRNMVI